MQSGELMTEVSSPPSEAHTRVTMKSRLAIII